MFYCTLLSHNQLTANTMHPLKKMAGIKYDTGCLKSWIIDFMYHLIPNHLFLLVYLFLPTIHGAIRTTTSYTTLQISIVATTTIIASSTFSLTASVPICSGTDTIFTTIRYTGPWMQRTIREILPKYCRILFSLTNWEIRIIAATPMKAVTNHINPVVKLWRDRKKFKIIKATATVPILIFLSTILVSRPAKITPTA